MSRIYTNTAPVATQQSHYYAFGMEMEALTSAAAPNKYRYNGKELNEDFGLNWSDYGARWYNLDDLCHTKANF